MKHLLLGLVVLGMGTQLYAYNIIVENQTDHQMRVKIRAEGICGPKPNGGDFLAAHTRDQWPTHNGCRNIVTFIYPDGSDASAVADGGALGGEFIVYRNDQGEYHWRRMEWNE